MTTAETREPTLLSVLREPRPHVIVRSTASVAVGCLLAAVGLFSALLVAELLFRGDWWWRTHYPLIGLSAASVAWLLTLRMILRPVRGRRQIFRPIFSTLAIWACAIMLAALLERSEPLVAIVVLLAIALTLYCWASAYVRWVRGRAVLGPDNVVDVRCPQCRYSLVGLTECRCPECGFAFTIDGLIAAQGYGGIYSCGEAPRADCGDAEAKRTASQLAPA